MSDDVVRLKIEALGLDGDGVAHRRGATWLVPGTVPGDVVDVLPAGPSVAARGVRTGRVLRLVEASAARVVPACAAATECGGCDWAHVAPEPRRHGKLRLLREALGLDDAAVVEVHPSPEHCRRAARFAVGRGRGGPVIGFRQERSRRVVAPASCHDLEPELAEALGALAGAGRALGTFLDAGGDELRALSDAERRIHLADAGGGRTGVERRLRREAVSRLREALPAGLRPAGGAARVEAADGGPPLRVPVGGFVQANRAVGLELARVVAEGAGPTPGRTIELYAGSGHLTVALLRGTETLLAVEADGEAAAALAENLAVRAVATAQAVQRDAVAALRGLRETPALVVADPPRAGLQAAAYEIARLRPPRVLLVSCDLRALARDRRALGREGYAVVRVALCDMFPSTHQVEAVTVFALRP